MCSVFQTSFESARQCVQQAVDVFALRVRGHRDPQELIPGHGRDLDPMLVEQPLRELRVGARQPHARHLEDLLVRPKRLGAEQGAEVPAGLTRQGDAALAVVVLADESDRVRHREVGGPGRASPAMTSAR